MYFNKVYFEGNVNIKNTKKIVINHLEKILRDCGGMIEFEDFLKMEK